MSAPRPTVAAAYDAWSATYDADVNRTRDLDAQVLRTVPLDLAGRHVVEVGCGTGKNTGWLAERARSVIALDFSEGMLAVARRRVGCAGVRFVCHDLHDPWPLDAASAGVVVIDLVLEHVADLGPVFAEAARVLEDGGICFVCELHPARQRAGAGAHFLTPSGETVHVPAHRHTLSEFVAAAADAGLVLHRLGEWIEEGAPAEAPPRLLSLLLHRPPR